MEEKYDTPVPYIVHESNMVRMERTNHRLWMLCIILVVALLATNAGWIWYESQWEVFEESTVQEVSQTAESNGGYAINRFVGGNNVESYANDTNDNNN